MSIKTIATVVTTKITVTLTTSNQRVVCSNGLLAISKDPYDRLWVSIEVQWETDSSRHLFKLAF